MLSGWDLLNKVGVLRMYIFFFCRTSLLALLERSGTETLAVIFHFSQPWSVRVAATTFILSLLRHLVILSQPRVPLTPLIPLPVLC